MSRAFDLMEAGYTAVGKFGAWKRRTITDELNTRTETVLELGVRYRIPLPFVLNHLSPLTADEFKAAAGALGGIPPFAPVGRKPDGSVWTFMPRNGRWMPVQLLKPGHLELLTRIVRP